VIAKPEDFVELVLPPSARCVGASLTSTVPIQEDSTLRKNVWLPESEKEEEEDMSQRFVKLWLANAENILVPEDQLQSSQNQKHAFWEEEDVETVRMRPEDVVEHVLPLNVRSAARSSSSIVHALSDTTQLGNVCQPE